MRDSKIPPDPFDWLSELIVTDDLVAQLPAFQIWCRFGSLDEAVPLAVEGCWRRLRKLH
jgi:hypothetical protein